MEFKLLMLLQRLVLFVAIALFTGTFSSAYAAGEGFAPLATISPTTTLTKGRICNTDGRDIACNTANPEVLTGGVISATGVSATTISATTFYGDGSNLTGVSTASGDQIISGTTNVTANNNGSISFTTAGTEGMVLDSSGNLSVSSTALYVNASSGNLGLGTNNPTAAAVFGGGETLHVVGSLPNVRLESSSVDLTLGSDSSSGYIHSSGKLKFFTNDNNIMEIDTAGNVGIGTVSPSATLHVAGDIYGQGISITGLGSGPSYMAFVDEDATNYTATTASVLELSDYFGTNPFGMYVNNSGKFSIQKKSAGNMFTMTGSTLDLGASATAVFVDTDTLYVNASTDKVGIGTTDPSETVHIVGGNLQLGAQSSSSGDIIIHTGGSSIPGIISYDSGGFDITEGSSNADERYVNIHNTGTGSLGLTVDGKVGIGTTTPANSLTVVGDISATYYYGDGSNLTGISTPSTDQIISGTTNVTTAENASITFTTAGTQRMVIGDTGNVGIGTSTPKQKLEVSGDIRMTSTASVLELANSLVSVSRSANKLKLSGFSGLDFYDSQNSLNRMVIDTSGNVGIGTTTPATLLDVSNTLHVTDTGKVGIGTDSPSYTLHIHEPATSVHAQMKLSRPGTNVNAETIYGNIVDAAAFAAGMNVFGTNHFSIRDVNDGTTPFSIEDGALDNSLYIDRNVSRVEVGVGTADPQTALEVAGTISATGISVTGAVTATAFYGDGSNLTGITTPSTDQIISGTTNVTTAENASITFTTAGTERMVVGDTGNVGIGTSSPTALLAIQAPSGNLLDVDNGRFIVGQLGNLSINGNAVMGYNKTISVSSGGTLNLRDFSRGDDISLVTAENILLLPTGNVGIGTTNPSGTLHISSASSGITSNVDSDDLIVEAVGGNSGIQIFSHAGGASTINFGDTVDNDAGNIRYDHTSDSMRLRVAAAERMRIDSSGNVGIGTSTPQTKLEVAGTISATGISVTGAITATAFYGDGSALTNVTVAASGVSGSIQLSDGTNTTSDGSQLFWDGGNERLGIGTSTPASVFEIKTADPRIILTETDSSDEKWQIVPSSGNLYIEPETAEARIHFRSLLNKDVLVMDTNSQRVAIGINTPKATLDVSRTLYVTDGGKVGIGKYTPQTELEVIGTISATAFEGDGSALTNLDFSAVAVDNIVSGTTNIIANNNGSISFTTAGTERVVIKSDGQLDIGNTSINTQSGGSYGVRSTSPAKFSDYYFYSSNGSIRSSSGAEKMYFSTAGDIGIGTSVPTASLTVVGGISATQVNVSGTIYATAFSGDGSALTNVTPAASGVSGSIQLSDGTNTTSDGSLLFWDGGNERLGIGIATPSANLHVEGDGYALFRSSVNTNQYVQIRPDNSEHSYIQISTSNGGRDAGIGFNNSADSSYWRMGLNISKNFVIEQGNIGSGSMGGNASLIITEGGNIGISTTTPQTKLEVAGTISATQVNVSGTIYATAFSGDGSALTNVTPAASGVSGSIQLSDGTNTTSDGSLLFWDGGNERLGIGTNSPSNTLNVVGSYIGAIARIASTLNTGGKGLMLGAITDGNSYIGGDAAHYNGGLWRSKSTTGGAMLFENGKIKFLTDNGLTIDASYTPTARMTILASGNVGIGTTSPSEALHVVGNATISGTVQVSGSTGDTCGAGTVGMFRLNPTTNRMQLCRE